jgi:hypothetical protein
MASTKVINGQALGPDGVGIRAKVLITLSASGFVNGNQEVLAKQLVVQTAQDGTWQANLYANADITPTGSTYAIAEGAIDGSGSNSYKILVPQTAGPFNAASITTP